MKNIHPLQSAEWGKFREKTGVKVVRENDLQITIHPLPHTKFTIGYLPKGPMPTKQMLVELERIGKREKCIFIQLEPNVENSEALKSEVKDLGLVPAAHPLFTKYTFILDLTKSEEELLKNMHQKTRYNIRVAEKKGVKIIEDNSDKAFEEYLRLTKETTTRQNFYAHSERYHRLMWETLKPTNKEQKIDTETLTAHLLKATYQNEVLVTWIVFVLGDTLYYPYGASSTTHREVMASNLMMWEAIRFGKKLGLKTFDMWGALGPNPNPKDPWYGFHRFKEGYGPKPVEFIGSFDFVINKKMYFVFKILNKVRWAILKAK
jgi:lipid II:glycine glycyltransferase (peptidoglycan interpeptide bridge formation enzyme)